MADSENGYFLDVQVYVGRECCGNEEKGLGKRVVLKLTEPLAGRHHHVFCDNFFSSPSLFIELLSRGTYACGTVRLHRKGIPIDLRHARLAKGEIRIRQSGNLTITLWRDKRIVSLLSTMTQPADTTHVTRREGNDSKSVICPTAIKTYNMQMAGVDKGDQLRKYYSVRLKCNKNYKYIFWFLFDVSITNAFILNKFTVTTQSSQHYSRLKQFRVALAKRLLGDYCSRQTAGRPSILPPSSMPKAQFSAPSPAKRHFPRHHARKRCIYCRHHRTPNCRKESVWQCIDCEGTPSLCLTGRDDDSDCWRLWHAEI